MRARLLLLTFLASTIAAVAACGDDDNTVAQRDAGTTPDATTDAPGGAATQKGRIVEALQNVPLGGATVSIAGNSATTGADGLYSVTVPKNTPYQMTVTAPDHYKLLEQEWSISTDLHDQGDTSLLSTQTANLLASFFPNRDPAKGLLVIKVVPMPPCTTEEGTTLSLEPPGDSKIVYFSGGTPLPSRTNVKAGESFSAAFYNIEPGAKVSVKVAGGQCAQKPFPVTVGEVTYTGNTTIEGGEALTFERVFIMSPTGSDGGSDAGADAADAADADGG